MMAPAAVAVSPLIKAARYTALLGGIFYGGRRQVQLQRGEDQKKAILEKEKVKKDKLEAAAKTEGDSILQ
ncbi:ATP synthase F(0) complex subunit e, mitochondrial-like [Glandiceps talaboti]